MSVLSKAEIAALSSEERLALIENLWDSFEKPPVEASVEAAHTRIVRERLEGYDSASDELLTLDEVCERLHSK
jgi:putative addiction module component (TIGR02574 family)